MGITRDSRHKRSHTSAKRPQYRKKRKFELGRQAASTKLGARKVHEIRVRGGNKKFRALRLESGNFAWGSESVTCRTRIIDVVYNASNNELVRTKTLVKGAIVEIDATPFRQWYERHYALPLGRKPGTEAAADEATTKKPNAKIVERQANAAVEAELQHQFVRGRLYAVIGSRPGQTGRADGYICEGKELEFYHRKLAHKR